MGLVSALRRVLGTSKQGPRPRSRKRSGGSGLAGESPVRGVVRSTGGFALGMTLASLYGALVLFAESYNVWYCLVSTASLGAGLGLGMAFSSKVRVTVLLMLPHVFSKEGKHMLLLVALGMAMQGPCTNILRNFARAAQSVSCGAELTLNQTAELLQKAREPLLSALTRIKAIAQKAKVVGDRVRKFFRAVMDSVRHVARALRNVWYWLVHVGEVCNQDLGAPYTKCLRLFDTAKDECERVIPALFFLCYILLLFKPLCGLANALLVFCVIPQYVQPFLRRRVVAPVLKVLSRVRREFEFNISAVHQFDVSLNSTKSLAQVALDIMEAVGLRLQPAREVLGLFAHVSSCVLLYLYLQALLYRRRYLHDDDFDNIYITGRFLAMDVLRAQQGRPTVLPLSARESTKYICPGSPFLSRRERFGYSLALAGVLRHVLLGLALILLDYGVFWLLDLVRYQLHGEIVARAPVVMSVSVNGTGYTGEIYRDLVSAFDSLQRGNVSVLSRQCRLRPAEPDYRTYLLIGLMYGVCFFIAIFGSYVGRLRRVICASYYPSREQERTCFLYNTILTRRTGLASSLLRATRQRAADEGHTNLILILASKLPLCAWLARRMGVHQQYCMGCGRISGGAARQDFITCITPGCRGIYCRECYQLLSNVCSICMAPLAYQGDVDEEIDSSDEETVGLWLDAARALRGQEQEQRRRLRQLLRQRIRQAVQGQGSGRRLPQDLAAWVWAQLEEDESGDSTGASMPSPMAVADDSSSDLDFSYQDQPEGSDGEGGALPGPSPPEAGELEEVKMIPDPSQ
ncbi:DC-STAMP domain-containing protein 2 [Malaclemys terrapin pileata]|uniref:DC-STAMP domain-containing protein 2 n=1 Tax=Malaclemys terrapin pileata TaxID=2991368 RepID=UPI0023A867AE|nr:DC-STAMP domain-containing protein 2 [Malaclemys terrapin pileata]